MLKPKGSTHDNAMIWFQLAAVIAARGRPEQLAEFAAGSMVEVALGLERAGVRYGPRMPR